MTMLYKKGSTYNIEGYDVDYIIADDEVEGELDGLLEKGWKKTIYETTEEKVESLTKEDIIAKLEEAGIEFDKRWGIDKLKGLLDGLE